MESAGQEREGRLEIDAVGGEDVGWWVGDYEGWEGGSPGGMLEWC